MAVQEIGGTRFETTEVSEAGGRLTTRVTAEPPVRREEQAALVGLYRERANDTTPEWPVHVTPFREGSSGFTYGATDITFHSEGLTVEMDLPGGAQDKSFAAGTLALARDELIGDIAALRAQHRPQ
jgi:hypothetical protein